MDAAAAGDVVLFGEFRFDRSGSGLFRADGSPVPLGSRALAILQLLIERQGQLVSKQQILDAVWPGLAVEEGNLTVQMSALRRTLDQDRTEGSCIQTVPGRGYRFLSPVTYVTPDEEVARTPAADGPISSPAQLTGEAASVDPIAGRPRGRLAVPGVIGLVLLAALLILGAWQGGWFGRPAAAPPRLSVAVLPFENLSGNSGEDYLADAVTDDVTTDLSRLPGISTMERLSAYSYHGKVVDVRKVGMELGVRYVVQGSVRKMDDVLWVNAQLVSTESGAQLWAERFDQPMDKLSAGQEEIVGKIAETLNVALTDIESVRGKRERPTNPDAFDLIIRARSLSLHTMGSRDHAERRALYEQALRLDPTSLLAMTGLADELLRRSSFENLGDEYGRAAKLIADAAVINPNHPGVLDDTAFLLFAQGRYVEAIAAYQHLLREYPNVLGAYSQIGYCLISTGRAEEAIPLIEKSIRRDPRNPRIFYRYENLGHALLLVGRDEESIVWTKRALAANPNIYPSFRAFYNRRLAAAYGGSGSSTRPTARLPRPTGSGPTAPCEATRLATPP